MGNLLSGTPYPSQNSAFRRDRPITCQSYWGKKDGFSLKSIRRLSLMLKPVLLQISSQPNGNPNVRGKIVFRSNSQPGKKPRFELDTPPSGNLSHQGKGKHGKRQQTEDLLKMICHGFLN